jgi:hypothetical protein
MDNQEEGHDKNKLIELKGKETEIISSNYHQNITNQVNKDFLLEYLENNTNKNILLQRKREPDVSTLILSESLENCPKLSKGKNL